MSVLGVSYPFELTGGNVAMSKDQAARATDRVVFCLSTQVGERVMRPSWGIDIMRVVHELEADIQIALPEAVAAAFRQWFPDYSLTRVRIIRPDPDNPTVLQAEIAFKGRESQFDIVTKVGIQVPDGSEIYGSERIY